VLGAVTLQFPDFPAKVAPTPEHQSIVRICYGKPEANFIKRNATFSIYVASKTEYGSAYHGNILPLLYNAIVMPLQLIPIPASSHILTVLYDDENMLLYIQFKRGAVYVYSQVPGDVADGFTQALSAGQYLETSIKGAFEFQKMTT
jgi:KTSC domain-containing protein